MTFWIIPMAGAGRRISELGECKPAITVGGRPIIGWCLAGLARNTEPGDHIIGITTSYFEKKFRLASLLTQWSSYLNMEVSTQVVTVPSTPPGPAATVFEARHLFESSGPVIVVNADQFCLFYKPTHENDFDAYIPLYVNTTGNSSYAELNNTTITRIVEKKLVSCYASAGVYGFRDGGKLRALLEKNLSGPPHFDGEYFVGPAINALINEGGQVIPTAVSAKFDLGNVDDIRSFSYMVEVFR